MVADTRDSPPHRALRAEIVYRNDWFFIEQIEVRVGSLKSVTYEVIMLEDAPITIKTVRTKES